MSVGVPQELTDSTISSPFTTGASGGKMCVLVCVCVRIQEYKLITTTIRHSASYRAHLWIPVYVVIFV